MDSKAFKETLTAAGYRESDIDNTLRQFERDTYPQIVFFHKELYGEEQLMVTLNFHTDGLNIDFKDGRAGLFRVPVEHGVIAGIDTVALEQRMLQVNWAHDHRFLMEEFPDDKGHKLNAMEIVPAIYRELDELFRSGQDGRLVAEQLCVKYIAWHLIDDRNDPLMELIGPKYYAESPLAGIENPDAIHQELRLQPIPDIDIAEHIGNFIDRQLRHYTITQQKAAEMNFETPYAEAIIAMLEEAQDVGFNYVVWGEGNMQGWPLIPSDLSFFDTYGAAQAHQQEQTLFDDTPPWEDQPTFHFKSIADLVEDIKKANHNSLNQKNTAMNLNNLQDLQAEARKLGFNQQTIDQLEPQMRTGTGYFNIREQLLGDNNLPIELTLHLRKSNESEYYNLNKFEAVASKIPQSPANEQYMVLTENKDNKERPLVKTFESGYDAIEFFNKQKGNSELAVGSSPEAKQLLASMEKGTINYVNDNFRKAFYGNAVSQTFYVQKGVGFTAQQAANMVQGRTVHRDNMLNPASGETYAAWIKLDMSQPKDDYGNYKTKQMNDPRFGFDLEKTLSKFKIKELADPSQKAEVMEALKRGDRIEITVTGRDNKDHKVQLEAVPQFKTMDFFTGKGDKLKRELYQKTISPSLDMGKDKAKAQDKTEDLSVGVS